MNVVVKDQPEVVSGGVVHKSGVVAEKSETFQPVSFRKCRQSAGQTYKLSQKRSGNSWNSLLKKLETKPSSVASDPKQADQRHTKSFERRASPRHTSDAIVLAFDQNESDVFDLADGIGKKGYAINVSRNGISFAARLQFQVRDRHQLHVEEASLNFSLDVTAEVLRCEPLDHEFWRVDCKLATPLSDQQILLLKEHVPACYAG